MREMSETAKSIVRKLGYPCRVFAEKTPYEDIVNAYHAAVERGKKEGFTPVLVPADDTLEDFLGYLADDGYSAENVLKEETRSGKEILQERFAEYSGQNEEDFDMDMDEFIGEYDGEPDEMADFSSLYDYNTGETAEVILVEAPTKNPWETVAYIPFGGWNECPDPGEMAAICKYWYEEYGAVPVTISSDVLEMSVPAPVGEARALEAAKEHYAFTPDRVDQGTQTGTLSEVAASVAVSKIWFFWWD